MEIYLDNSATTKLYDEVNDFIYELNKSCYGNPSSLHMKGIKAQRKVEEARSILAAMLSCKEQELIFTSGGTEANNLAIKGYLEANPRKGRHVITSLIEHPSVLECYKYIEKAGYKVDYIKAGKDGRIDLQMLENLISDETVLISIMHVNNETGSIQPLKEISALRNRLAAGAALHVDAVQSFGKTIITPSQYGIDLMSVSSHKIHGPKGVGALYVSKAKKIKPLLLGGGHEHGFRSGTENLTGICGFGMAAGIAFKNIKDNYGKVSCLNNSFRELLKAGGLNIVINSSDAPEKTIPHILNISFPGTRSEVLMHHLEQKEVYVSTGSACSSKKGSKSHVLTAMGLENTLLDSAIRFSFTHINTIEEIESAVMALQQIIPKLAKRQI